MPVRLHDLVIDAHDLPGLARSRAQALGWRVVSGRENDIVVGTDENAPAGMCVMLVTDPKTVKNRVHPDLTIRHPRGPHPRRHHDTPRQPRLAGPALPPAVLQPSLGHTTARRARRSCQTTGSLCGMTERSDSATIIAGAAEDPAPRSPVKP